MAELLYNRKKQIFCASRTLKKIASFSHIVNDVLPKIA